MKAPGLWLYPHAIDRIGIQPAKEKIMASVKKKWVAFKGNSTIPADVVGEEEDLKVQAGEAVLVTVAYAKHVVADGFADYTDAPAKGGSKKRTNNDAPGKVEIQQLQNELNAAKGELAQSAAEVAELKGKLQTVTDEADNLKLELSEMKNALGSSDGLSNELGISTAQTAVTDAQAALVAAEGTDGADGARAALQAAQEALSALQG
ncbi:hypothetical protein [Sulfitobacter sp.]|uniref:hypothetical protein n=1 Tax=Sulfitobacter sp. TaxID=1903071 RepID=UPI00300179BB